MSFLPALQQYIHTHVQGTPKTQIVVAVSGGPDSMALLCGLEDLRAQHDFSLIVAHVNHMLRGDEAWRDQAFVQQQAKRLGLPCYYTSVDVKGFQHRSGLSPQHAARQLRYHFLLALQRMLGARYIALGHTADDHIATLLLRLVRGSSPDGLTGIPAIHPPFIRPLIEISRAVIQTYLQSKQLPWIEDSSNAHRAYLRNRVRLDLLPTLQQYNPQIGKRLHALGALLQTDHTFLREQVTVWSTKTVHWQQGNHVLVQCDILRSAPLAIQRRLLLQVVHALLPAYKPVNFQHICSLHQLVTEGHNGQRYTLPGGLLAKRQNEILSIWNPHTLPPTNLSFTLPIPGEVTLVGLSLRLIATVCHNSEPKSGERGVVYVNLQRLHPPLTIRFPKFGDRFVPLGMRGEKKLQDFFIDNKVRQVERATIPLVVNQGDIVWVVGQRIGEAFKVTPHTTSLLCLRCVGTEHGIV